jgi:hypothetical protein
MTYDLEPGEEDKLAASLLCLRVEPGRTQMLQSIRKVIAIPEVPILPALSTVSMLAFGYLLVSDSIQPIAVYLLQLYLAF